MCVRGTDVEHHKGACRDSCNDTRGVEKFYGITPQSVMAEVRYMEMST